MKEQKEIKIQVPDGYEIDKQLSTFEKIVFKETKQVLTYESISKSLFNNKLNFYITNTGKIESMSTCTSSHGRDWTRNHSSTKEQLESILALNKLCNVAKYLNGSWLPKNCLTDKWYIYIDMSRDTIELSVINTVRDSVVYFKAKELAQQAIDILGEEEIRKALTLNW